MTFVDDRIFVDASEVDEFIKNNPDIKTFYVKHVFGSIALWTKTSYKSTDEFPEIFKFGQYDTRGNFVFIDNNLWKHYVYNHKTSMGLLRQYAKIKHSSGYKFNIGDEIYVLQNHENILVSDELDKPEKQPLLVQLSDTGCDKDERNTTLSVIETNIFHDDIEYIRIKSSSTGKIYEVIKENCVLI